jgi:hypothetical protein
MLIASLAQIPATVVRAAGPQPLDSCIWHQIRRVSQLVRIVTILWQQLICVRSASLYVSNVQGIPSACALLVGI